MSAFPVDKPFVLQTLANPDAPVVIEASSTAGEGLFLAILDETFSNLSQQFVVRMQNNQNSPDNVFASGPAFVNLGNPNQYLSVTAQGNGYPLTMQPWTPGSASQDAWSLFYVDGSPGGIRIAQAGNLEWSWNDSGGDGQLGQPIILYNDANANSAWQVLFVDNASAALPDEQPYVLLSTITPENGLAASAGPGQGLSLAASDPAALSQQFVLRMQNNSANGYGQVTGISFVNLGGAAAPMEFDSVIGQDQGDPLLLEPWVFGSLAKDAMVPSYTSGEDGQWPAGLVINQALETGLSWTDLQGEGQAGQLIYSAYGSLSPGSVWTVKLV